MFRIAFVFVLSALAVNAQGIGKRPPPPPKVEAPRIANPFWTHPFGDDVVLPCAHMVKQHPGGDLGPCLCPPVLQHPGGDEKTVACVHKRLQHPGGDDTGQKVPCVHIKNGRPEHSGGDSVMAPCTHWVADHPDGDKVTVPCVHVSLKHPNGEPGTNVPCVHLVPQHPEGHKEMGPCAHLVEKKKETNDPPVNFFTDDPSIMADVRKSVDRLKALGVVFTWPRPLSVFYREPINGNPDDNNDPFWNHYNPVDHSLVITKDPAGYTIAVPPGSSENAASLARKRVEIRSRTVRHEVGHAITSMMCVVAPSPGNPHSYSVESDEAEAIAEGWADFVASVLTFSRDDPAPEFSNFPLETGQTADRGADSSGRSYSIPYTQKVEFRVNCILWDLYDQRRGDDEHLSLEFKEIYKAWSPTLVTLTEGPVMKNLDSFLDRIKKNTGKDSDIEAIRSMNMKKP